MQVGPEGRAARQKSPRPGPDFGDLGIVLRSHKLGEADKIIRVLTREHGKRSAVAKGLRKTTSRFGARLEPFTCARLLVHTGRSLDIVRQAEIETSFHEVREDIALFVHASGMAELIDGITQEHEPHPELFDLMLRGLSLLKEYPTRALFTAAFFDYRALALAEQLNGRAPNVLASIKDLMNDAPGATLTRQLASERDHFVLNLHHNNAGVGIAAFLAKQRPSYE